MNNPQRLAMTAYRFRAREFVNRVVVDRLAKVHEYTSGEQCVETRDRLSFAYALVLRDVLREVADSLDAELKRGETSGAAERFATRRAAFERGETPGDAELHTSEAP